MSREISTRELFDQDRLWIDKMGCEHTIKKRFGYTLDRKRSTY